MMPDLTPEGLEAYLSALFDTAVKVHTLSPLSDEPSGEAIKGYGYGLPVLIEYEISGQRRRAVLESMKPGAFGHEHMADRAQAILWEHSSFSRLKRHARSLDAGGFLQDGKIISLGKLDECFLLMKFEEGQGYNNDLMRLKGGAPLRDEDTARADALCDYLVDIHQVKGTEPGLYVRRIRELLGHGECIMGLTDSYPPQHGFINAELLERVEHLCLAWRWRIKGLTHRLCQMHGDFHPWNILFREGVDFTILDRSRGEWGEPGDDVACLTMNYLFFSLQQYGRLEGPFEFLFQRFWERYLEKSGDDEMLRVVAPFFALRGLVMASPLWYPHLSEDIRQKLFAFTEAVLNTESFDPQQANAYCGA